MLNRGIEKHDAELDAEADVERILAELRDALERVRSLGSLLTVCGSCKDIREADGEWHSLERFLQEHLGVRFSHGLCSDCGRRLLEEIERPDSGRV
jgi:two-component system cell cycle response regulator